APGPRSHHLCEPFAPGVRALAVHLRAPGGAHGCPSLDRFATQTVYSRGRSWPKPCERTGAVCGPGVVRAFPGPLHREVSIEYATLGWRSLQHRINAMLHWIPGEP